MTLLRSAATAVSTLFLVPTLAVLLSCATPLEREQKASAVPFAQSWLQALDAGDGEALWVRVSSVGKLRVIRDVQLKYWLGSREPLGKLVSRRVEISWSRDPDFIDSVPEGTYWQVSFQSEFENKDEVFEDLLLRWEDGQWGVLAMSLK